MAHSVVNIAVGAAHAAGEIMRRHFQNVEGIPILRKARHDYVSEVDRMCEAEIVREIKRYFPNHAFLCEEGGASGEGNIVWIIDPLDGTSNYLHGYPHFGVSIAQQVNGRTEHGVIYDPMRDELFTASRGGGAFLNNKRLRVSSRLDLEGAIVATAFPFRSREYLQSYGRIFQAVFEKVEDFRRAGTACLDLAWVAAGRLDGFFEVGLKPWDLCAGALIVREAGGVVMSFDGEDDVENKNTLIAAPYKLMTQLRKIIRPRWSPSSTENF